MNTVCQEGCADLDWWNCSVATDFRTVC